MQKFINVSSHPSAKWNPEQTAAALALAADGIQDVQFPNVPPTATEADIATLADSIAAQIPDNAAAMVSGEFTLTYAIIRRLRARGLTVVAATTDRVKTEVSPGKFEMVFTFVKFRAFE
ncbi:MAG: hypothetical protein KBC95_00920 [Candidatus Peribacteraceae bacterium]|nr:hypothetical protein [Candidatus Peribacteraceae bacterium]